MALAAGTQLGPYEVIAPLGAGGMGEVYRARDERLGREVAVKVLPEELADEPDRLRRFEREAKATGGLNHPNILAIHDIGEHEKRPYVVYELLEGQTLGERLREGPLLPHEALTWALQVALGLAAAHAKGIVHRDLKPENLFLTKAGPLKILDFGLAKVARPEAESDASIDPENLTEVRESLTAEGAILGTVGYMSPEQVKGERADHRSDIFSLGVVLYEMLSGRRPFRGGTAPETMAAILKEDPPALAEDEVFPPIAEVVGRCLAKEPAERFQSAHDLALALEVLAASVAETRPAVAAIASASTPVHWGRRLLLLGGALVVVTGLVLGLRPLLAPTRPSRMVNPRIVKSGDASPYFATDGKWLYQATPAGLFQMSVTGGEPSRLDPWPDRTTIPAVRDLNPADATQLLVSGVEGVPESPFELAPLWVLSLPAATPRRVGEILSSAAVWSPDGGQIAFANGRDVYVVGADGRSPRKIATVEGMAAWVDEWWPDGRIVYGSYDFSRRTLESWEVRVDGSEQRRLLPDWPDPIIWDVDRTPDGRTVVFVSGEETGGRFWALEEGRGEPVALTTDPLSCFKLDLAPDGSAAYSNCAHVRSELFTYRSEIGQWAPYEFAPESSAWWLVDSPDGEWVAWIRFPEGTLWRGRRDGTQKLRLTEPMDNLYATFPSWSPDGRWIVFGGGTAQGIVQQTFVVSRDGEGLRRLDHETVWANRAAWSPDGRVILSFWDRLSLRLVNLETGETEDMPGTTDLWSPTLSPDGRFLAASRRSNAGGEQLRLLDWKTGEWRDLEGAAGGLPAWSGDSRFLYFQNDQPEVPGEWQISRYRVDDGHIETVAKLANLDLQSALIWWTVDPEDRVVAQRSLTTNDIYVWDLVLP